MAINKTTVKQILGDLPYTAELYWHLRQRGKPSTVRMSLSRLNEALPQWIKEGTTNKIERFGSKKVLIFGMIRYWLEHTSLLGLALNGMGHRVTLAYLPYAHWRKPINRFDLRRQNTYIRNVLECSSNPVQILPLLDVQPVHQTLPKELADTMDARAFRDTQYAMLMEEVDRESELFSLRLERDSEAALTALDWMVANEPDVVIIPNGSILEFGVIYEVARYLNIPTATFEFGEQNYRVWIAQNGDVMQQDTSDLWHIRGKMALTEAEKERIYTMFSSRQGARPWETFARQWQGVPSQGSEKTRSELGLDSRPLAFLPTNVLGDSLTLGRQIFTGMTEWLRRTIRWFIEHAEYQLVIRVHPGEQIGWGPSVYDILTKAFPSLTNNIRLLPANAKVNSYDLVESADLGLVYTTTMGMEMVMSGMPVIVVGRTHYREKGFTLDPNDWDDYFDMLDASLKTPEHAIPSEEQVNLAWTYAYRFFFEYPQPFPWHIQHFWECVEEWPLARVLSEEGMAAFGKTFHYLVGEPIDWDNSTV